MLFINEDCINCNACIDECPNSAIYQAGDPYSINGESLPALSNDFAYLVPELCKMCEGHSEEPSCITVCPSDAIVSN